MATSLLWTCLIFFTLYSVANSTLQDSNSVRAERSLGDQITKKTWRTVGILVRPYMMVRTNRTGADEVEYEGFIPDLLRELSSRLGITFDLYTVPDGRYGSLDENNTWTGMIGEVVKMENNKGGADMAAAPLTITAEREQVVDFVKPFIHSGLTILMRKPHSYIRNVWNQRHIFHIVGIGIPFIVAISTLLVALVLWLMNKFNPNEWGKLYKQGRATKQESERFTYAGALWYTFTILQWQGFDRSPRCLASRFLSCVWFLFVLMTLVMYLASLTGWLGLAWTPVMRPSVNSLSGLARQTNIRYGVVSGGSTHTYLTTLAKNNKDLRQSMESYTFQHYLVRSTEEGIRRARQGNYAFILNELTAEYATQCRPCDLQIVGKTFGSGHYGMALPNNVDPKTKEAFDSAILMMHESGFLAKLKHKWWYDKGECGKMSNYFPTVPPPSADLYSVWPLFAILATGLVATAIASLVEIIHFKKKGKYEETPRDENKELEL